MKDIEHFEGKYAITKEGKVWSHRTQKFLSLRGSGKRNKLKIKQREYRTIGLYEKGHGHRYFYVHRLVAKAFIPNPNGFKTVNHKDGNPKNNDVSNLEWCSMRQNIHHAFLNGFTTRGYKNGRTVLDESKVRTIRAEYAEGKTSHAKLGIKYGVAPHTIKLVIDKKNWAWVT